MNILFELVLEKLNFQKLSLVLGYVGEVVAVTVLFSMFELIWHGFQCIRRITK